MKVGFITDIHEDVRRLDQAIGILQSRCEKIVCLGDTVGYTVPYYGFLKSRNAHECVELVKKKCYTTVLGNHDLAALTRAPKHEAGIAYPKNWQRMNLRERARFAKANGMYSYENDLPSLLQNKDVIFLGTLPEFRVERFGGLKVLLSHYAYPDLSGSLDCEVDGSRAAARHLKFLKHNDCSLGISGHDHTEGLEVISENRVRKARFGSKVKISGLSWAKCPCVANGTVANGVAVLDTDSMEMVSIPLGTKRHPLPAWRLK